MNGHAHLGYLLNAPILKYGRPGPLAFAADVERGLRRRLGADPAYGGLLVKNPIHESWVVSWIAPLPYQLTDLANPLKRADMVADKRCEAQLTELGRNVAVFDETRRWSYRAILQFKRNDGARDGWRDLCERYARACNNQFATPLPLHEVRTIAKSIAKWTWPRFDEQRFSAVQSQRAHQRWKRQPSAPWKSSGLSRATYFRRKKANLQPSSATPPDS
jgi:hypothetical protein